MCRLQCLRRRFCNGYMLSPDDVYRHSVFRIPFPRPLSRFLSDRRIQRLERMTRTADFADGLTTDCKVCFYVMTKYIRLCQHHRIKNKGNNPEKELGLCVFPKMFPKFVEHTNYGSVSLFSMLNLVNLIAMRISRPNLPPYPYGYGRGVVAYFIAGLTRA